MLHLESRGLGSIPTRGAVIFILILILKFCNPNLNNIVKSDRIRFKMKNLFVVIHEWSYLRTKRDV